MSNLLSFSDTHIPHVNSMITTYLGEVCTDNMLKKSMDYSIAAGGKRFRPLLLLATSYFCHSHITTDHYKVAAALEMIHTYSLIHDDLPAMDNDDLRRGQPTNHKVFGDALAILAGDGLLTDAFGLLCQTNWDDSVKLQLIQTLSLSAGSHGMVAGQSADMEAEHANVPLKELQSIHTRKTGALIEFAVFSGALIANVPHNIQQQLLTFSQHLGVAFQIKDDLLDVVGDEFKIGKKTGMDAEHDKSTYPSLLGVEGAKKELYNQCSHAKAALQQAKRLLEESNGETTLLDEFIQSLEDVE